MLAFFFAVYRQIFVSIVQYTHLSFIILCMSRKRRESALQQGAREQQSATERAAAVLTTLERLKGEVQTPNAQRDIQRHIDAISIAYDTFVADEEDVFSSTPNPAEAALHEAIILAEQMIAEQKDTTTTSISPHDATPQEEKQKETQRSSALKPH